MPPLYEDRFNAVTRRVDRARRSVAWRVRRALGQRPTVLVEIQWRLGDEIMAIPVYEAMQHAWPGARLIVHCTYPEMLEGNPFVDAVNAPCPHPDRYICLRDASRTVQRISHYASLVGVPVPTGRPRLFFDDADSTVLQELPEHAFIALSAGATWPTKRWEAAKWQRLVVMLREAGWATVELGQGHAQSKPMGADVSLMDRTTVRDAACVLRRARAFIGSDSGLMHLALAVDTPAVALFGPTEPAVLVGNDPRLRAVTNGRPCQGCWNGALRMQEPGVCPLSIEDCLEPITPESVFEAVQSILTESDSCASSS